MIPTRGDMTLSGRNRRWRDETEWVETVERRWNVLVGAEPAKIIEAIQSFAPPVARPVLYGDHHAACRIARILSPSPDSPAPDCEITL